MYEEEEYIKNTLKLLLYPTYFIHNAKRKAYKIYNHNTNKAKNNNTRRIIKLTNTITKNLNNSLHASDIQIVNSTSKTMNDIINKKVNKDRNKNPTPETGVYSIRCASCNKSYIGETSRPFKKRIYEHKQALKK